MSALIDQKLQEEHELARKAIEGCPEAFGELVRRYQYDVRGFLYRYLFDSSVADDVAQEVFLSAVTRIGGLEKAKSIRAWLLAIARYKAIDYLRSQTKAKYEQNIDVDNLVTERQLSLLEKLSDGCEQRERIQVLRSCIDQLELSARELVVRFYFNSESAEKIAKATGKKAG